MSDRVQFTCNGEQVEVSSGPGESLLSVLREQLGIVSVKDGCAPQGQCGCCTVLVDGDPRVACVTPATRVAGRAVTTVEGLDPAVRWIARRRRSSPPAGRSAGSARPGIVVRAAALRAKGKDRKVDLDRALAAHLCRCTGWQTVYDAIERHCVPAARPPNGTSPPRRERAALEGGVPQIVGTGVPLGAGGFADDHAPRDALVAVPCPPAPSTRRRRGGRGRGDSRGSSPSRCSTHERARERCRAGARPRRRGRRSICPRSRPGACGSSPAGWSRRTSSPTRRGARPEASPRHRSPTAARSAARPTHRSSAAARASSPTASVARCASCSRAKTSCASGRSGHRSPRLPRYDERHGHDHGSRRSARSTRSSRRSSGRTASTRSGEWSSTRVPGPATSSALRAVGLAERAVLVEGALDAAGVDRASLRARRARRARLARHLRSRVVRRRSDTRSRARASTSTTTGRLVVSRCASPRAIRSTRSCCARTRSAPRTWRSAGC